MHKGYCLKCKKKRGMKQAHKVKKKMRYYLQGICEICETKVSVTTKK